MDVEINFKERYAYIQSQNESQELEVIQTLMMNGLGESKGAFSPSTSNRLSWSVTYKFGGVDINYKLIKNTEIWVLRGMFIKSRIMKELVVLEKEFYSEDDVFRFILNLKYFEHIRRIIWRYNGKVMAVLPGCPFVR